MRAPTRGGLQSIGGRFIRVVSIGLTAFLIGGAGVAVATIALAPLGTAIGAFMRLSRSADRRQVGNDYAPPKAAGHSPVDVAPS